MGLSNIPRSCFSTPVSRRRESPGSPSYTRFTLLISAKTLTLLGRHISHKKRKRHHEIRSRMAARLMLSRVQLVSKICLMKYAIQMLYSLHVCEVYFAISCCHRYLFEYRCIAIRISEVDHAMPYLKFLHQSLCNAERPSLPLMKLIDLFTHSRASLYSLLSVQRSP